MLSTLAVILAILVVVVVYYARGFTNSGGGLVRSGKIRVVTTFLPIYVFTANVAGGAAEVVNLLPPGVGPHDYSFTPADVRLLASADVIVMNGLGLESWMQKLIIQSGTKAVVVDASAGITSQKLPPETGLPSSTPSGENAPGDTDPHIWLDPVRAEAMVKNIAAGLSRADPADQATYQKNFEDYGKRLAAIDEEYRAALAVVPDKEFVAFHSAFGYLAARYGLVERAVIEEFPGKEPGAQYLAALVDLIKKNKTRALFSEPQFSPRVVQTVAVETGARVYALDTAEVGDFAPGTYEKIMRDNLKILVAALSQSGNQG